MSGFFPLLWWTLGGATALGAAVYLFLEYQAYMLRTKVINIPGGLRFVAQGFAVEVRHKAKEILVLAKDGSYKRQALPDGEDEVQTGAISVTLAAAGLRIEVARISVKEGEEGNAIPTGLSRIVLVSSDEPLRAAQGKKPSVRSELILKQVPDPIAADFQQFSNGLRAWIDKIEQRLAADLAAQRQREEEAATEAAGLAAAALDDVPAVQTEEERRARADAQLEKWRKAAGFKGSSTELSFDERGRIVWLIDLDPAGRVILHAANRTFHGSLKGATVTGIGAEMEISVRDDYWSDEDPRLVSFRVLTGTAPEVRRAWKERLDILIQSLGGSSGPRH